MTMVYISRHSQPFRKLLGEYKVNEIEQIRNEKNPLSVDGEKYADQMSNYPELLKVESLYSSHYVRAMATAKYIAEKNGIELNVDERLVAGQNPNVKNPLESDEKIVIYYGIE